MKSILPLLLLGLTSALFAQNTASVPQNADLTRKFSLGIIGGFSQNKMPFKQPANGRGYPFPKTEPESAYFIGLSARQPLNSRLAAILDASFSVRGFGYTSDQGTSRFRFDYLDFTPQVEYNVFKILHLSLGSYFAFRMEEHVKFGDSPWGTLGKNFVEIANDFDFGIVPGATLRFDRVSVLVRYQHGLASASEFNLTDDLGQMIGTVQRHNRCIQVGLGFRLI